MSSILKNQQLRKSNSYNDAFTTPTFGIALESRSSNLLDDLNAIRTQLRRGFGLTNWYDTPSAGAAANLSLVSSNSTTTPNALYTMTSAIDVEFEDSLNNPLIYFSEATNQVGIGTNASLTERLTLPSTDGAITIGDSIGAGGVGGSIRYRSNQFESHNGTIWSTLGGGASTMSDVGDGSTNDIQSNYTIAVGVNRVVFEDDSSVGLFSIERATGNIGIGITNPGDQLNIYRNSIETTPQLNIEQDGTGDSTMVFTLTGGQAYQLGIDNTTDSFLISRGESSTYVNPAIAVESNGQIGFNVSSATSQFEFNSTVTTFSYLLPGNAHMSIGQDMAATGDGLLIGLVTAGLNPYLQSIVAGVAGDIIFNPGGGNVGIGFTNPTSLFHSKDALTTGAATEIVNRMEMSHSGAGSASAIIDILRINTDSTTTTYGTTVGTVTGINISVDPNNASGTVTSQKGVNVFVGGEFGPTITNNYGVYIDSEFATNNWGIYSVNADYNYFNNPVGIGITNPTIALEVRSTSSQARFSRDASNFMDIAVQASGRAYVTVNGNNDFIFNGPFVGIGTTNAIVPLHIRTTTSGDQDLLRLRSDSANADIVFGIAGSGTTCYIEPQSGASLRISTGGAARNDLYITSGGLVGIGTSVPSGLLEVKGGDVYINGGDLFIDAVVGSPALSRSASITLTSRGDDTAGGATYIISRRNETDINDNIITVSTLASVFILQGRTYDGSTYRLSSMYSMDMTGTVAGFGGATVHPTRHNWITTNTLSDASNTTGFFKTRMRMEPSGWLKIVDDINSEPTWAFPDAGGNLGVEGNAQVIGTFRAGGYQSSNGTAGWTGSISWTDGNSMDNIITVKEGLITAWTQMF